MMGDKFESVEAVKFQKGPFCLADASTYDPVAGSITKTNILIDADGHISDFDSSRSVPDNAIRIDVAGKLVTPAFVDCHQHLDKSRSLPRTKNPSGTLLGAIKAYGEFSRLTKSEDIRDRARATIRQCLARGTTALRSHVNIDDDIGFTGIDALAEIREDLHGKFNLQLVSFLSSGATQNSEWLANNVARAAQMGDAIGGTPAISSDPKIYLDCLFAAAEKFDKPIDLHMDEHLNADVHLFDEVLDRVERFGMQGRTCLGHCSVLSAMDEEQFKPIIERLAKNDVSIVALPTANLYLQGRDADMLNPRGLTRIVELAKTGVNVAIASDNIHDVFVPIGSGDMAEIARWTLVAAHLGAENFSEIFELVSGNAAKFMGLDAFGVPAPGNAANLLISDTTDVRELICVGPIDRTVISNGHLVHFNQ